MNVTLYSFQKRNNSTKRPSGGTTISGQIKDACTVISPSIAFSSSNPLAYNYAYIPEFSRYYWISNWSFSGGLWVADMQVDVLASWRDYIGSSTQFVVRSSASYNPEIIDSMYPATNISDNVVVEANNPFNPDNPMYIVGVMGKGVGGAITYYLMSQTEFASLGNYLLSDTNYLGDLGEMSANLIKAEFNPLQYITSTIAIPFSPYGPFQEPITTLFFGWWDLGFDAQVCPSSFDFNTTFSIPRHPQQSRGTYLNGPPYSSYTLILPPFGMIPLDGNVLAGGGTLKTRLSFDIKSNSAILYVRYNDTLLYQSTAQFGATVQIGQVATSKLDMVGNALGVAGSIFEGDISGAISGGIDALKSVFPQTATKGSNGSLAIFKTPPTLCAKFMKVTDEDNADIGKPLYKPVQLSSIPGFIMTREADISAPATAEEITQIETTLNGGVFYE